jgi:peptidoglycan/xylan/chitin deacetylase (PgdA/CDA1 family)
MRSPQSDQPCFSVTFDDGLLSDYEVAFPELARRQLSGTFFIPTGLVGQKGRVSWSQLAEMSRAKMKIGSHTHTHPYLTKLTLPRIREELAKSRTILEDRLGVAIDALSIPEGNASAEIFSMAHQVGYRVVATSVPGFHRHPAFILRRNVIHKLTNLKDIESLLQFSWRTQFRLISGYIAKSFLKRTLGISRYEQIRETLWGKIER